MAMKSVAAGNIDEYIAGFPAPIQQLLEEMRATIRKAAPAAQEAIKYAIPTFTLNGNLVHFAGYAHHIGFYPAPSGILEFKKELAGYESAKGSVRFPLDKPLPLALVAQIVKFRVAENMGKKSKTNELSKKASASKLAKSAAKKVTGKKASGKKSKS